MTPARTIVIIGATSGLGRRAAQLLAADGHRLVLVGRDPRRALDLRSELPAAHVISGDVATRDGIGHVVEEIGRATDTVDTLVNNAGVMLPTRQVTAVGIELNLAVHHARPIP